MSMISSDLQNKQRFTKRINDHVNQCQICQQGTLCDIAEGIMLDEETRVAQAKQEKQAELRKQAGLQ